MILASNPFRGFAALTVAVLMLAPSPTRAASINGHDYVPLSRWARANGFYGFPLKHGAEMVLTNRHSRLVFTVDSAQVEINGVEVRLSLPIAREKDVPFISQLDVETAIHPLIHPPKKSAQKITTICLDPGHGGKDTGNRVGQHDEKTYTMYLALDVRDELKKAGFKVLFTRTKDVYVGLPERPAYANRHGADLFVSLHFNATASNRNSVAGVETYCITPVGAASSNAQGVGSGHSPTVANRDEDKSLRLAYEVQKALVGNLGMPDRSVRRARFAVLCDAKMPAILIESGYMTNPREGKKIYTPAYRHALARAIARGILNYQKLTER